MVEVRREGLRHGGRLHSHHDLDPRLVEPTSPRSGHLGIRVQDADDHPGHPGINQGVDARSRPSVMGARLERDHDGRTARPRTCHVQGNDLGMATTWRLGRSDADHGAIGRQEDRSDPRVGRCPPSHGLPTGDGIAHVTRHLVAAAAHRSLLSHGLAGCSRDC